MSLWVCIRESGFDSDGCLLKLDVWTFFVGLGVLLIVSFFAYKVKRKPRHQELNDQALQHVDYEENIRLLNELLDRSARVIEGALTTASSANGISEKGTQQPPATTEDKATDTESDSNGHSSNGHSSNGHSNNGIEMSSISSNGITSISSNGNSSSGSSSNVETRSRIDAERFKASLNSRPSRRPRLLAHPSLIRVAESNIIRNPTALRVAGRKKYIRPRAGAFDAVYLVPRRTNGKKAANGSNGGSHRRQRVLGLTAAEAEAIRQTEIAGSEGIASDITEGAAASGAEGAAASGAEGAAASGAEGAAASGAEGAAASGAEGAAASGAEGAAASGAEGAAASGAEGAAASGAEGAAASGSSFAAATVKEYTKTDIVEGTSEN